MPITLNTAITSVIQFLSECWKVTKKYETFFGPGNDLLAYYLGGSSAWRLALNLPLEDNPDYDFYFQGKSTDPQAADWKRQPIGRVFQRFLGMNEADINNKEISKRWEDKVDGTNSYYMWSYSWENVKYDFNIGSLKVYSNFQIRINVQTGEIDYDYRIPSHEADFKRFAEHHEIITYGFESLTQDPNAVNRLRVLSFVLKSYLKPLSIGKKFSYETAKALVDFKNDPLNNQLMNDLRDRFENFYRIPADNLYYIFVVAEKSLILEQKKIIEGQKLRIFELEHSNNTLNEKVEASEKNEIEYTKEMDDLKESIKKDQVEIKKLIDSSQKNAESLSSAVQQIQEKDKTIQDLQGRQKSLDATIAKQLKEINGHKSRIGQLQSDLDKEKAEIKKLKDQSAQDKKLQESSVKEQANEKRDSDVTKQRLEAEVKRSKEYIETLETKEKNQLRAALGAYFLMKRCVTDEVDVSQIEEKILRLQNKTQSEKPKNNDYRAFVSITGSLFWMESLDDANLFMCMVDTLFKHPIPNASDNHQVMKLFYTIKLRLDAPKEYSLDNKIRVMQEGLFTIISSIRARHLVDNDKINLAKKLDLIEKLSEKFLDPKFVSTIKSKEKESSDYLKKLEKNFILSTYELNDNVIDAHLVSVDSEFKHGVEIYQAALKNPDQKSMLDAYLTVTKKGSLDDLDKILNKKEKMGKKLVETIMRNSQRSLSHSNAKLFYEAYYQDQRPLPENAEMALAKLEKHLSKFHRVHIEHIANMLKCFTVHKQFHGYDSAFSFCTVILVSYNKQIESQIQIWEDLFNEKESLTALGLTEHESYMNMIANVRTMRIFAITLFSEKNKQCIMTLLENAEHEPKLAEKFKTQLDAIVHVLLYFPRPWEPAVIGNCLLLVYIELQPATRADATKGAALVKQLMPVLEVAYQAKEVNCAENTFKKATATMLLNQHQVGSSSSAQPKNKTTGTSNKNK
jgi:hypothetical protein